MQLDTDSVEEFARATRELKFESYNGGRDSKERLAQVIFFVSDLFSVSG